MERNSIWRAGPAVAGLKETIPICGRVCQEHGHLDDVRMRATASLDDGQTVAQCLRGLLLNGRAGQAFVATSIPAIPET